MRLTQTLRRAVLVRPDAVATIDGDRVRTWRQVHDRVQRLSGALRGLGVREGDRVAVLANNCDAYFEAYFGILWSGAVIVPLNTRLAPAETRFQLEDAGVTVMLFGEEFAETAAILSIPPGTVMSRVYRARQRLRIALAHKAVGRGAELDDEIAA